MFRVITITMLALVVVTGCSREPEVPQAVAIATAGPSEAADKEVLIASTPSEATVLLKGAQVGKTPMKLLVRDDTNLVLQKEGYIQQALLITPKSDPNIVVELVPSGDETAVAVAEEPEDEETGDKKAAGKGSSKTKKKAEETVEPQPEPEPEPAPTPTPLPPTPEPKAEKPGYATMQQLKAAIKSGKITKAEYAQYQQKIREKRAAELQAAEKDYKAGKLTKAEFKAKVRAIKLKYEG